MLSRARLFPGIPHLTEPGGNHEEKGINVMEEERECFACGCSISQDEEWEKVDEGYLCSYCSETYWMQKCERAKLLTEELKRKAFFLQVKLLVYKVDGWIRKFLFGSSE
jgi:hypothetical protein